MNHPQQAREKDKSPNKEEEPKEIPNQGNSLLHDVVYSSADNRDIHLQSLCCEEVWFTYDEKSVICDRLARCLLNSEKAFCVTWDSVTLTWTHENCFITAPLNS